MEEEQKVIEEDGGGGGGGKEDNGQHKELSIMEQRGVIAATKSVLQVFDEDPDKQKSVAQRMKEDERFAKPQDHEIEYMRHKIQDILQIIDASGNSRIADLTNEGDMKMLAESRNVFITKDDGTEGQIPKQGFIKLRHEKLPEELRQAVEESSGIIPIMPEILKGLFEEEANSLDDILLWIPLINLPVYTSNLTLLLTGQHTTPVVDSFSALRLYIVIVKYLLSADFIRSRKDYVITWLESKSKGGELTRHQLENFLANIVVFGDDNSQTESDYETSRSCVISLLIEACLGEFNINGNISEAVLKIIENTVKDVKSYEGAPWLALRSGFGNSCLVFKEEIIEECMEDRIKICKDFYQRISSPHASKKTGGEGAAAVAEEIKGLEMWYKEHLNIIYEFTFKYLHSYEIQIMRLLQESCFTPCIPQKFRSDLITTPKVPPEGDLNENTESCIIKHKNEVLILRNSTLIDPKRLTKSEKEIVSGALGGISSTGGRNSDILDTAPQRGMPTYQELNKFLEFLSYYAETKEDLIRDISAAKSVIEKLNNPLPQIEKEMESNGNVQEDDNNNNDTVMKI